MMRRRLSHALPLAMLATALILAGCGSSPKRESSSGGTQSGTRGGGYYKDDGPPDQVPADLALVPDALPDIEPLASGPNKPYQVFGKRYVPDTSGRPYRAQGRASWYGRKFHGQRTSNGDIYDMYAMTAAHTTLPIPSYVRVTRVSTGQAVLLRVNDRGPFHSDRIIDVSYVAAYKLGLLGPGSAEVQVEALQPAEIARIRAERANGQPTELAAAPRATASVTALQSAAASRLAPEEPAPVIGGVPMTSDGALTGDTVAAPVPVTFGSDPSVVALEPLPRPLPPPAPAPGSAPPANDMPWQSASATSAGIAAPTRASPSTEGVYLQVGAFSGQRNAEDLLQRLRNQLADWHEPLRIVLVGNLHRVRIGPYSDRVTAQLAADRLQARANMTAMIVMP